MSTSVSIPRNAGTLGRTVEVVALAALTLALWVVPAMVSQGQDRTPETLNALHVDSPLIGHDAAARAALADADRLALAMAPVVR